MKKKILTILTCVVLALNLTACDNSIKIDFTSSASTSYTDSQTNHLLPVSKPSWIDSSSYNSQSSQQSENNSENNSSAAIESPYQSIINKYEERVSSNIYHDSNYYRDGAFFNFSRFSLFVEVNQSFSGDTYSIGFYDNDAKEWLVPMNSELTISKSVRWDKMIEQKGEGTMFIGGYTISYIGNNTIYCSNYCNEKNHSGWCYNIMEDKFFGLESTQKGIYAEGNAIIIQDTDYTYNNAGLYILNTDDQNLRCFLKNGHTEILLDKAMLAYEQTGGGWRTSCYYLYDYNGNLIFSLPEYNYDISNSSCKYNGIHLMICANGKDSGKYILLFNNNGDLLFDPIAFENIDSYYGNKLEANLFDTFFTIANFPKKNYYDLESGTVFFYDYSGNLLTTYRKNIKTP